jgi:hypothetical protein
MPAHQRRYFKDLAAVFGGIEGVDKFRDEKWILARQGGNELRIQSEVIFRRMAGPAGAAIALEGLLEKEPLPNLTSLDMLDGSKSSA